MAETEKPTEPTAAAERETYVALARPGRINWARLLKRVFGIDMLHFPNYGAGELKVIAAILARPVIEKILDHLGLIRSRHPRAGHPRRDTTSPPEPRRPSQTDRHGLRCAGAAEVRLRRTSSRPARLRDNPDASWLNKPP